MLRKLLNLKGVHRFNSTMKNDLNELDSDEEWKRMEKKLEKDVDRILDQGVKKKKNVKGNKVESDGSANSDEFESTEEWTDDKFLGMMKHMEFEFDRRKRESRSNFWINAVVGVMFGITATFLVHLYTNGQWRALAVCQGDRPAKFCHSCYGPFSGEWLWCLEHE